MPGSKVTVQHQLGKAEALRRIKDILGDAQKRDGGRISDVQETWTDDGGSYSFKAGGFKVSGSIDVRDTDVEIDVSYPLAARPFKEKIESTLRDRAESVLAA
jgi:Putative polyhydroxyalkanoic acid system protein (PHA_gran_rgn)